MGETVKQLYESNPEEMVIEIETERLRDFHDHPFKIKEDRQMKSLKESIEKYGILTPLIVRPVPEGCYEIISGHRRRFIAKMLGYRKVPVIIRVMRDDEAVIAMIDANNQREEISISEKAFAYKMKYEALRRRSERQKQKDNNPCSLIGYRGKRTVQILGEEGGDSPKQVQRYLRIPELIPELIQKLDAGGTGSALDAAEDDLITDIGPIAAIAFGAEVMGVVKEPFTCVIFRQSVFSDFFRDGGRILTQIACNVFE